MTNCAHKRTAHSGAWNLTKPPLRFKRLTVLALSFVAFGLTFFSYSIHGQAPQLNSVSDLTQTPIPGAGHDYQHLLGETVNFSNGSVSFKISFPVPKSRGITLPYAWSYNSASVNPLNFVGGNQPAWDAYGTQGSSPIRDGWNTSDGLPYATVQVWTVTPPSNQNQTFVPCNFQSGMTFTDSSGVMHNLYTAAQASANTTGTNVTKTCGTVTIPPNGDGQVVAKLDPNTAVNDLATMNTPTSGGFVVIDKNGTTYSFAGGVNPQVNANLYPWIEDRNGNVLNASVDTAGRPGPTTTATSPVTVPASTSNVATSFSMPTALTIGGINYTAAWGTTPVSYIIATAGASGGSVAGLGCVGTIPTTVSGNRVVLTSLTLPNLQQYQFFYNNSYGLLSEIIYPDGGWVKYQWTLPSTQNELAFWGGMETTFPNGSGSPAVYTPVNFGCGQLYQAPVLSSRTVSFDGTNVAQSQNFSYSTNWITSSGREIDGWSSKSTTVTSTDAKTGLTDATAYSYLPYTAPGQPFASGSNASQIPLESTIAYYDWGQTAGESTATGTPLKTVAKTWLDQFNMQSETTTINATGQVSGTVFTYVSGLGANPATASLVYLQEQDDYDYGTGALPIPATSNPPFAGTTSSRLPYKKTIYGYTQPESYPANFAPYSPYTSSSDQYPLLFPPQVASVTLENVSGAIQSASQYTYDAYGTSGLSSAPTQHDPYYPANTTTVPRGNLTSVTLCNPVPAASTASCTGPTVKYTYDYTGQPNSMTDARNNQTTFSFTDNPVGGNAAGNSNAYLSAVTYPNVNSIQHQKTFAYNYGSGYLTISADENTQTTTYSYANPLLRLTDVYGPLTPNGRPHTQYSYVDGSNSSATIINPNGVTSTSSFDGMEHVIKTQLTTDPYGTDTVLITYNGEGQINSKTNPFRGTTPGAISTYYYDALGRSIETQEQDGSILQSCYNGVASTPTVANCAKQIGSVATGTWVDSTDENGNHWQRTSDAFGRLAEVMEPNGATQGPSMETDYGYDALNNLLLVKQCGALCTSPATNGPVNRSFSYDSLSRLVLSSNPEAGSVSYTYDANSNLLSKTDARSVTISYSYDALNRLLSKSYSSNANGTPFSCYQYDTTTSSCSQSNSNLVGRLTNAWTQGATSTSCSTSGPSSGAYLTLKSISCYDPMGRPASAQQQQCIGSKCSAPTPYSLTLAYDLAGNMTGLTNSVGASGQPLTLTHSFDGAGHPCLTTSSWNDNSPLNIFQTNPNSSTAGYTPFGALQNWFLGSTSPNASGSCTDLPATPLSPINFIQTYTPRNWVNGISVGGQIP